VNESRRSPSPFGLTLVGLVLAFAALLGANLGKGWLAGRATEIPLTEWASAPPPVTVEPAATTEAKAATPEPTLQPAIGPQLNIAVVVVNSLDAPEPQLEAVWVAALHTEQKTAFLLGLSPYLWVKAPEGGELRLRDAFKFDPDTASGGAAFDAILHQLSYAPLMGSVTVDELLLSEVVNRLGGVDLSGSRMDGAGAVAHTIYAAPPDPLAHSQRQTDFAYALRDAAALSLNDPNPLLDLLLERGRTDISPEVLRLLLAAFHGYNPAHTAIAPPVADPQLVIVAPDGLPAVLLSQDYPANAGTAAAGP
jgi:hypothetical protein